MEGFYREVSSQLISNGQKFLIFPRLFRAHKYKVKTNNSLLEAKLRVYGSCLNISEKMVQFSNQDAILVSVAIFQIKKAQASGIKPCVLLDASRAFVFSLPEDCLLLT